jgi:hypothetical protein
MDISPCSNYMVTGSYNKSGHVIDISGTNNTTLTTSFEAKRGKAAGAPRRYQPNKKLMPQTTDTPAPIDFKKKVTQGCWSPKENMVALAFRNCIFMYSDSLK